MCGYMSVPLTLVHVQFVSHQKKFIWCHNSQVFAHVLLVQIQHLHSQQSAFTADRSTTDVILAP